MGFMARNTIIRQNNRYGITVFVAENKVLNGYKKDY